MRSIRLLTCAALAAVGTIPLAASTATAAPHAASAPPQTVPALQSWTAGPGSFTWTATSRVVIDPAYAAQLSGDANTFASDLSALEGRSVAVATGAPDPGDIQLTLGGTQPTEGYTMTVGAGISIQGSSTTGEFWGTRSVLQMLHQGSSIPAGTASDAPLKPERGLMIDAQPKFVPVAWIENQIRDMSYLKMNFLTIGFGARLVSSTHPEIKPTIFEPGQYTKQDIANIIAVADAYHVTVVPEIDMPAHMDDILAAELAAGHDYRLKDSSGNPSGGGNIDVTMPAARQLISDLLGEYLPEFSNSPYWHLGCDEIGNYSTTTPYTQLLTYAQATYGPNATAKDSFYGFVNWADSLVRGSGKTLRMWNDQIDYSDGTVPVNPDIVVEYWTTSGKTPNDLIADGHLVANEAAQPTYYDAGQYVPDTTAMYETWTPDTFQGNQSISNGSKNLGSQIHVWYDNPGAESVDQTAAEIPDDLRDMAQMVWGSPRPTSTYAAFVPIEDAIGRNPLYPSPRIPGDLAQGKPTTASSVQPGTNSMPDLATDGDPGSRWSSAFSDPQWIQVDLGSVQTINRVVLDWEAAYGKTYQLQTSNDGTDWTTLYTQNNGTGGTETLTGFTGTGRYIRMYGTARGTQYGYSLYEFEVFDDHDLALNQPTTASSVQPNTSYTPNLATDGNPATRWSSDFSDPQWLQVDLGSQQTVTRVVLTWEAAYGKAYQIQMSNDGTDWNTVYTQNNGTGGTENVTGFASTGRYIRLLGTARGTQWGYSLWSFQVYDDPDLALNQPTTASSVEPNTNYTPNLATDGTSATRWSSAYSDPQWLQVDLGSVQTIGRVVLAWETAYGKAYQIQVSDDATNWSTVYTQNNGTGGTETLAGFSATGRFIRLLGTTRGTQWGYSLWSFQVYAA